MHLSPYQALNRKIRRESPPDSERPLRRWGSCTEHLATQERLREHSQPTKSPIISPDPRFWNRYLNSPEIRSELSSSLQCRPNENYAPIAQTRLLSVPPGKSFLENRGVKRPTLAASVPSSDSDPCESKSHWFRSTRIESAYSLSESDRRVSGSRLCVMRKRRAPTTSKTRTAEKDS
jgi:hypothetical protein